METWNKEIDADEVGRFDANGLAKSKIEAMRGCEHGRIRKAFTEIEELRSLAKTIHEVTKLVEKSGLDSSKCVNPLLERVYEIVSCQISTFRGVLDQMNGYKEKLISMVPDVKVPFSRPENMKDIHAPSSDNLDFLDKEWNENDSKRLKEWNEKLKKWGEDVCKDKPKRRQRRGRPKSGGGKKVEK